MYVRLAFAVAAHLEPDVLILDEVLAVGDAAFQQKCLDRVGAITRSGRTAILVSHNMAAVANLCQSAVWLQHGQVRDVGQARPLVDRYLAAQSKSVTEGVTFTDEQRRSGMGRQAQLERLEWLSGMPSQCGAPLHIRLHLRALAPTSDLSGGVGICTLDGTRLLTLDSDYDGERPRLAAGETATLDLRVPALPLGPGNYTIDVGIRSGTHVCLDYFAYVLRFEVIPGATTPDFVRHFANTGVRMSAGWTWGGALAATSTATL
jgi:energy-coupling factor transporter ATP-binding protein EcfA2